MTLATPWSAQAKACLGGFLVAIGVVALSQYALSYLRKAQALSRVAASMAQGKTPVRIPRQTEDSLKQLASSLADLAEALDRKSTLYAAEQEQAEEILSVMADGVLVVDEMNRIVRANPAASRLLDAPLDHHIGSRAVEVARGFPTIELAQRALATGHSFQQGVELLGSRYLSVQVIPLQQNRSRYVLFILHDETETVATERVRKDFAANVSHELKTPIAGLMLLAETLQHAVKDDPEHAASFASRILQELRRLSGLVNDLLTLAGLEQSSANPSAAMLSVDLSCVSAEVAEELRSKATERQLSLEVDTPSPAWVIGDRVQLATVVRNLLDNAIRFTDPGGTVRLTVRTESDGVLVTVADTGIGIPLKDQARIFERFYRVDKARSRETGGTGLGLSIVKHIVELHKGVVTVDSRLGMGSTFTVRLPAAPRPPAAHPNNNDLDRCSAYVDPTAP